MVGETTKKMSWQVVEVDEIVQFAGIWPTPFASIEYVVEMAWLGCGPPPPDELLSLVPVILPELSVTTPELGLAFTSSGSMTPKA